jgi:hypothetical protein
MNKLHKSLHPRIVFLLISVPFILICPLTIASIVTGFPFVAWSNNNDAQDYEAFFDEILIPESTRQIGESATIISNFYLEPKPAEGEVTTVEDDEIISNACDLVSAKILISSVPQKDLSAAIVNDYSAKLNLGELDEKPEAFDILFPTKLTLLPVNLETEITFATEKFDLKKDFKVNSYEIQEGEASYILLMYNNDAFESKDFRCQDK